MRLFCVKRLPERVKFMGGNSGSNSPSKMCGGKRPSGLYSCDTMPHKKAASNAPAAPNVCPVKGLVEVAGVALPNTRETARLSIASLCTVPVPCKLIQPIFSADHCAFFKAAAKAISAPTPSGCGDDI